MEAAMRVPAWLAMAVGCALAQLPAAAAEGVTDTEIRLGASVVPSGPLGPQTAEYGAGARMYFDAVNAAGGVHGRRISCKTLDDGFEVPRARWKTPGGCCRKTRYSPSSTTPAPRIPRPSCPWLPRRGAWCSVR
jgi:hypothetical protein